MLIAGSLLMLLAGLVFIATDNYFIMLASAIIGVISPSGYEVGPFLPIEQASLSQLVSERNRTRIFGWYNLVGAFATALGALCGGVFSQILQDSGYTPLPASGRSCWSTALLEWSWGLVFPAFSRD
jgi:MFS family permease